jgi:hypothetical protein
MNRLILLGIMLLSFSIAWLLYVFGYIFSPMAQQTLIASDEPLGLERASKIMIWGASVSLIAGIVAAGGVIEKHYIVWASAISIGLLLFITLASVISTSLYFFTPMCC